LEKQVIEMRRKGLVGNKLDDDTYDELNRPFPWLKWPRARYFDSSSIRTNDFFRLFSLSFDDFETKSKEKKNSHIELTFAMILP
jgi:hypothetical protein